MPSIRQPESIGAITRVSATTASLAASRINIGGQQYITTTALTLNTATVGAGGVDATLIANKVYYVYAVLSNGSAALIGSQASTLPSGFTQARVVGYFYSNASSQIQWANKTPLPIVTSLFSGSGTFFPQTTTVNMRVRMVGGAGGGAGSGTAAIGAGGNGTPTTFGTSTAGGGNGCPSYGGSYGGGATLGSGMLGTTLNGGMGSSASIQTGINQVYLNGGSGGGSIFGTGGSGGVNAAGVQGPAIGSGGGGGGTPYNVQNIQAGGGGGSGGYVEVIVLSPASFAYSVGSGGAAGAAGANGYAGGVGSPGIIEITES